MRLVEMVAAGAGIGAALGLTWLVLQAVERAQEWVRAAGWFDRPAAPVEPERLGDDLVHMGLLVDERSRLLHRYLRRTTAAP